MDEERARSDRSGRNATDPGSIAEEFINDDAVNSSEPPRPPANSDEGLDEIDEADLRKDE